MRLEKGQQITFSAIDDFTGDMLRLDGEIVSEAYEYIKSHPDLEGEYGNILENEAYIAKADGHYSGLHLVYPEDILEIKDSKVKETE